MNIEEGEIYAAARTHEIVKELLGPNIQGKCILDAACGSGTFLKSIMADGVTAVGIDVNPSANDTLAQIDAQFIIHDLEKQLPFKDGTFDIVTSIETVEHLWNPFCLLDEFVRVLKPGGTLIVTTPHISSIISRIYFSLTGNFPAFNESSYRNIHHVVPIHEKSLRRWAYERQLVEVSFHTNGIWLPYLHFRPRIKNHIYGQVLICKVRKRHATHVEG